MRLPPSVKIPSPEKPSLNVQVPIQTITEVKGTIQVPDGLSVLVPLPKDELAIVTPKIVAP